MQGGANPAREAGKSHTLAGRSALCVPVLFVFALLVTKNIGGPCRNVEDFQAHTTDAICGLEREEQHLFPT